VALWFRLAVAVGAQHRLAEGVELFRLERAEDVAVGLFGGAKAGAELPQAGGRQADAAAPAVVRVDVPPDQPGCLDLVERLDEVGRIDADAIGELCLRDRSGSLEVTEDMELPRPQLQRPEPRCEAPFDRFGDADDEAAAREIVTQLEATGTAGASFHLDLEDSASIEAAVRGTAAMFGGLDILVASAVRWPVDARAPLAEAHDTRSTRALRANLEGTARTVHAALPHLARSEGGRIVLISSGIARDGRAGATAYSTAKAALDGLLTSLKWEAGAAGVLVNIVSPGFTVTENNLALFSDEVRQSVRERTPSGRLSVPGDVAKAVLLLGSPANGNITGAYLPVAGGID